MAARGVLKSSSGINKSGSQGIQREATIYHKKRAQDVLSSLQVAAHRVRGSFIAAEVVAMSIISRESNNKMTKLRIAAMVRPINMRVWAAMDSVTA